MRITIRVAVALAAFAALASLPRAGVADRTDLARQQFNQGVELYEMGRFEQAAIAFARAYELKPSYRILFNIAQAENELEHYAAALEAYVRYLVDGGKRIDEERVQQVKAEIERLNTLVGSIVVECPVEGATVMIDGEVRGETPLPGQVFVDLGRHEVEVISKGERLHRQVVKVAGGQKVALTVEVVGAEPSAAEKEPGPSAGVEEASGDEDGLDPAGFYAALGITGALGIATVALELAVQSKIEDVEADPSDEAAVDSGKSLQTAEQVLLGLTAAGAAAAIVLAVLADFGADEEEEPEPAVSLAPGVVPGGMGLSVGGRF